MGIAFTIFSTKKPLRATTQSGNTLFTITIVKRVTRPSKHVHANFFRIVSHWRLLRGEALPVSIWCLPCPGGSVRYTSATRPINSS